MNYGGHFSVIGHFSLWGISQGVQGIEHSIRRILPGRYPKTSIEEQERKIRY